MDLSQFLIGMEVETITVLSSSKALVNSLIHDPLPLQIVDEPPPSLLNEARLLEPHSRRNQWTHLGEVKLGL